MLYFDMTFIYVGSMERNVRTNCYGKEGMQQKVYVEVHYNFETDTIMEEITPYARDIDLERVSVEREYFINDWQTDVIDKYTPFIINNIILLRGSDT